MRALIIGSVAGLLLAGCAARTPSVPHPFPRPGGWSPDPAPSPLADPASTDAVTATALALRGTPYREGGDDPTGFDCSGFTRYVFGQHGLALPRSAADQYALGHAVDRDRLAPGDLVFFTTVAPGASHVGVALGNGRFVHAPSARGRVRIDRLDARYWSRRYLGARRFVPDTSSGKR